jgi:hypothetical protein
MANIIFYMQDGTVYIDHDINLEKEELDLAEKAALILFNALKVSYESNTIPKNYH